MSPLPHLGAPVRRRERGSSYVTALLGLFVLTILGLALVVITQNEVLVGANERTITRVFYSAQSGLDVALSKAIIDQDYNPVTVTLSESNPGGPNNYIAEQARATALVPVSVRPCDWCPVNANGKPQYFTVTSVVNVVADRLAWTGSTTPPAGATSLGQRTLGTTFEYGPSEHPPDISLYQTTNPNLLNPLF